MRLPLALGLSDVMWVWTERSDVGGLSDVMSMFLECGSRNGILPAPLSPTTFVPFGAGSGCDSLQVNSRPLRAAVGVRGRGRGSKAPARPPSPSPPPEAPQPIKTYLHKKFKRVADVEDADILEPSENDDHMLRSPPQIARNEFAATRANRYPCHNCGQEFRTRIALSRHTRGGGPLGIGGAPGCVPRSRPPVPPPAVSTVTPASQAPPSISAATSAAPAPSSSSGAIYKPKFRLRHQFEAEAETKSLTPPPPPTTNQVTPPVPPSTNQVVAPTPLPTTSAAAPSSLLTIAPPLVAPPLVTAPSLPTVPIVIPPATSAVIVTAAPAPPHFRTSVMPTPSHHPPFARSLVVTTPTAIRPSTGGLPRAALAPTGGTALKLVIPQSHPQQQYVSVPKENANSIMADNKSPEAIERRISKLINDNESIMEKLPNPHWPRHQHGGGSSGSGYRGGGGTQSSTGLPTSFPLIRMCPPSPPGFPLTRKPSSDSCQPLDLTSHAKPKPPPTAPESPSTVIQPLNLSTDHHRSPSTGGGGVKHHAPPPPVSVLKTMPLVITTSMSFMKTAPAVSGLGVPPPMKGNFSMSSILSRPSPKKEGPAGPLLNQSSGGGIQAPPTGASSNGLLKPQPLSLGDSRQRPSRTAMELVLSGRDRETPSGYIQKMYTSVQPLKRKMMMTMTTSTSDSHTTTVTATGGGGLVVNKSVPPTRMESPNSKRPRLMPPSSTGAPSPLPLPLTTSPTVTEAPGGSSANEFYGGEVRIKDHQQANSATSVVRISSLPQPDPSTMPLMISGTVKLLTTTGGPSTTVSTASPVIVTFARSGLNSGGGVLTFTSSSTTSSSTVHLGAGARTFLSSGPTPIVIPGIPGPMSAAETLPPMPRRPTSLMTAMASSCSSTSTKHSTTTIPTAAEVSAAAVASSSSSPSPMSPPLSSKKFLDIPSPSSLKRPTSLSLLPPSSKRSKPSLLISPDTPRPKKSYELHVLNGNSYTYLGIKSSTHVKFCCLVPQPMFVTQETLTASASDPSGTPKPGKLSMYSNWQTRPSDSKFVLSAVEDMALYDSRQQMFSPMAPFMVGATSSLRYAVARTKDHLAVRVTESKDMKKEAKDTKVNKDVKEEVEDTDSKGMKKEEGKVTDNNDVKVTDNKDTKAEVNAIDVEVKDFQDKMEELRAGSLPPPASPLTSTVPPRSDVPEATPFPSGAAVASGAARKTPPKSDEDYTYIRGRGRGHYICDTCGIRCKKPSMLKKHIRTHTDLRPFICRHCNFSFKTKGNLTKHMKSKAHYKKCLDLSIDPVPTAISDDQIDQEALEKQDELSKMELGLGDEEDEDEDEDDSEELEEDFSDGQEIIPPLTASVLQAASSASSSSTSSSTPSTVSSSPSKSVITSISVGESSLSSVATSAAVHVMSPRKEMQQLAQQASQVSKPPASSSCMLLPNSGSGTRYFFPSNSATPAAFLASIYSSVERISPSVESKPFTPVDISDPGLQGDMLQKYLEEKALQNNRIKERQRTTTPAVSGGTTLVVGGAKTPPSSNQQPATAIPSILITSVSESPQSDPKQPAPPVTKGEAPPAVPPSTNPSSTTVTTSTNQTSPLSVITNQPQAELRGTNGEPALLLATSLPNDLNGTVPESASVKPDAPAPSNGTPNGPSMAKTEDEDVIKPSGSDTKGPTFGRVTSEEDSVVCQTCQKTFNKPSQLKLHLNIHYFERPFRCDPCAVSFRTKGHLQKHQRSSTHLAKVNMNRNFGPPTTENPRPFRCSDCGIAFRIHGHLAKHLRSKSHIMKLECMDKIPIGTYAEMERMGIDLTEIDTTDCENSLESLQQMAKRMGKYEYASSQTGRMAALSNSSPHTSSTSNGPSNYSCRTSSISSPSSMDEESNPHPLSPPPQPPQHQPQLQMMPKYEPISSGDESS
ncbi:unnamed protein product [Cyprideis torosa]|uniref:Uncharacterized protein n=1 Tax=Cyprideis torosa TaxID=163714 RepID=A0A7R8ZIM5_9CRUS|nr:unnamed protein product [Cyprideis torosa]CAG0886506.1 unnamed protein product [Cyprideis torosa]